MGEEVDNVKPHYAGGVAVGTNLHRGDEDLDVDFDNVGSPPPSTWAAAATKAATSQIAFDIHMGAAYGQPYTGLSPARKAALRNVYRYCPSTI